MNRCKPGDLAIIIKARVYPENVGRLVTVERIANENEFNRKSHGTVWFVKPLNGTIPNRRSGQRIEVGFAFVLDSYLRPIRPDEGEDETLSWSKPIKEFA